MATVRVPLTTALADLDEALRRLLRGELERHGIEGVEIRFDAPDREWAASLAGPTVNLFLYDVREATELRPMEWAPEPGNGGRELRPPLRIHASYAVTAWTREVEDEHRLLSQLLAVLYAYPVIPDDLLSATLANGAQRWPIRTQTAQARHEGASDFWSAVGGQYKASINYVVTLAIESGTVLERGPEVRSPRVLLRDLDASRSRVEEMYQPGGTVATASGEPISGAWVVLQETGRWAETDAQGRFRLDWLRPGTYTCSVRTASGEQAVAELQVPGKPLDIVVGDAARPARSRR
jgi:hypothetical protein